MLDIESKAVFNGAYARFVGCIHVLREEAARMMFKANRSRIEPFSHCKHFSSFVTGKVMVADQVTKSALTVISDFVRLQVHYF